MFRFLIRKLMQILTKSSFIWSKVKKEPSQTITLYPFLQAADRNVLWILIAGIVHNSCMYEVQCIANKKNLSLLVDIAKKSSKINWKPGVILLFKFLHNSYRTCYLILNHIYCQPSSVKFFLRLVGRTHLWHILFWPDLLTVCQSFTYVFFQTCSIPILIGFCVCYVFLYQKYRNI